MTRKTIKVDYLARVEGEGALTVVIRDGEVKEAQLRIFEPPRFFEAFLRGRAFSEAPDITARICGICPVAYQMSAVHAMEDALGVRVTGPVRDLRRLLYCGEWIESHTLHVYMLHAPDFLGYEGAIEMARDYGDIVKRGLALKKAGNSLMSLVGGREVHPINVRVGGFYKAPTKREMRAAIDDTKRALDMALETVRWVAGFDFPDRSRDYELVSLSHPDEYPLNEGHIISNRGLDITAHEYDEHFVETHVPHSNALHSHLRGRGAYLVGPLARFALNFEKLSPLAKQAAKDAGIAPICTNPYQSIIVRAVETVYACEESLRILETYDEPNRPFEPMEPKAAVGYAATEAPRGMLYHRYRIADDGAIVEAQIVPPTSQNQPSVEDDLRLLIQDWVDLPDDELRHRCEQTVRNYDPCISCATHFLDLRIDRG
jgi:coenzyme F420-reducing hydrogenase alpha subunit